MRTLFLVAFALAAGGQRSTAGFTTDPAAFAAALSGSPAPYLERFDGTLPGFTQVDVSHTFTGNGFAYTVTTGGPTNGSGGLFQSANGGVGGSPTFGAINDARSLEVAFATTVTVTAFAGHFFHTDEDNLFRATAVTLIVTAGGVTESFTFTPTGVASSYVGYTSSVAIDSVSLSSAGEAAFATIDDFTVGQVPAPPAAATPLPPTLVAALLGLLAVVRQSRRTPK